MVDNKPLSWLELIPSELQKEIFTCFKGRLVDLCAASLASKRWNAIVTPFIWYAPTFSSLHALELFRVQIQKNEKVGKYVKKLSIIDKYFESAEEILEMLGYLPELESIKLPYTSPSYSTEHWLTSVVRGLPKLRCISYLDTRSVTSDSLPEIIQVLKSTKSLAEIRLIWPDKMISTQPTDEYHTQLGSFTNLASLHLNLATVDSNFFANLIPYLPNLECFKLKTYQVPNNVLSLMSTHCLHLESLRFHTASLKANQLLEELVEHHLFKLNSLILNFDEVTVISRKVFEELLASYGVKLKRLTLCNLLVEVEDVDILSKYLTSELAELEIRNGDVPNLLRADHAAWQRLFSKCGSSLTSLTLDGGIFNNPKFSELIGTFCPKLRKLSLLDNQADDSTLMPLLRNIGNTLNELNIGQNRITSAMFVILAEYCHNLRSIHIQYPEDSKINASFLKSYLESCGSRLTDLNLAGWEVDDRVLELLQQYAPNLHTVYLPNTLTLKSLDSFRSNTKYLNHLEVWDLPYEAIFDHQISSWIYDRKFAIWEYSLLEHTSWYMV
ncbi:RNI-like protein [Basidiobolus meristosporus CBS 931.73]|uniref:RNI-like protein n=1 Tax=Basidiobolus meristosporus CBS 931.73 TaxID=1314790 RepID=A0A1Y1XMQ3_9FUNG|nr:RNI-like protein [Basidiobolus meristosporus CBS 931.73]|eukprot:ORX86634.1 RNI-like protein [Basidiobolus meristosporus CBS 931.73]